MTKTIAHAYETAEDLPPECHHALRRLLLACADSKLMLGYHYGEWTFGTPELEAAVASCSLAQSELGHVRLLHGILKAQWGDDPDQLVEARPAQAFATIRYLDRPIEDWTGFVAMNYVVDMAVTRVLHSMTGSAFLPVRMSVDKVVDEERYHVHHGQGWFRALAARDDARARIGRRVSDAMAAVAEWLGPSGEPEDHALVSAGIKSAANADLFRALHDDVGRLAEQYHVSLDRPAPPSAEGWSAGIRRKGTGGPDEALLYHLRGTKNAVFKLN
jgi:ring-1,2-phenylacetyl-CoA epoxidase subunit PaaC